MEGTIELRKLSMVRSDNSSRPSPSAVISELYEWLMPTSTGIELYHALGTVSDLSVHVPE